jgi:hypothetical protein
MHLCTTKNNYVSKISLELAGHRMVVPKEEGNRSIKFSETLPLKPPLEG